MTIRDKKQRLDELRPLSQEALASLARALDVELVYTSNALEGNTLTLQETAIVLEKGITVRGKPLKDHQEAVDHFDALQFIRSLATSGDPIGENTIKDIHRLVVAGTLRDEAGLYSKHPRRIVGSRVEFPNPFQVPNLMKEFGDGLSQQPPTYETAFQAHLQLVSIHPFSDGNGRTARLLMNLVLMRGGYPPVLISPADRPDYLDAIETVQLTGDETAYRAFMERQLTSSLERHLDHISGHPKTNQGMKPR